MDTIQFSLSSIKTIDINFFPENKEKSKNKKIENSGNVAFGSNCVNHILSVKLISKFNVENDVPLIEIVEEVQFKIEEKSWNSLIKDGEIVIPKEFLWHIAGLTISTTRGVLAAKAEKTVFSDFYLPLVNVQDIVKEDIVIHNTAESAK